MNYIRLNESSKLYLSESEQKTEPTEKFILRICRLYTNEFKKNAFIDGNFEKCFNVKMCQQEGDVYGTLMFSCVVDTQIVSVSKFVDMFVRFANVYGYNCVDYAVTTPSTLVNVAPNVSYHFAKVSIQLEALYIDGTSVIVGDYIYHVTTANAAEKIINQHRGLVPYNKCKNGFNYDARIYCFTDMTGNIDKEYAKMSGKQNIVFLRKDHKFFTPQVLNMLKVLSMKNDGAVIDLKKFVVLQIDTSKLVDMKFYRDNATTNAKEDLIAIYTLQNIPYQAISAIKTFVIQ